MHLVFLCPNTDLSVGVQTAVKVPLSLQVRDSSNKEVRFSGGDRRAKGCRSSHPAKQVNRREHLVLTMGPDKTRSHSQSC